MNVGGLLSKFAYVVDLMDDFGLDVLCVSETRLTEHTMMQQLCSSNNLTHVGSIRPASDDTYRPTVGGGIALLARKGVRLTPTVDSPRGGICARVQIPGREAFMVIGVYMPPTSAKRKQWRPELLSWIAATYKIVSRRCRRTVILGDFNSLPRRTTWFTWRRYGKRCASWESQTRCCACCADSRHHAQRE